MDWSVLYTMKHEIYKQISRIRLSLNSSYDKFDAKLFGDVNKILSSCLIIVDISLEISRNDQI